MPDAEDRITLDVFLLTLAVPRDHPDAHVETIRRTLDRRTFSNRLRATVTQLVEEFPTLAAVTVSVSR